MNRECRLLVLSPRARSKSHVQQYKPFQARFLSEILADAEQIASARRNRDYDRYSVFEGLFFGAKQLDEPLQTELEKHVPACVVDCSALRGLDEEVRVADKALQYLMSGYRKGAKLVVLICSHKCAVDITVQTMWAFNDGILAGYLGSDLCDNTFKRLGSVMGKRTDD